MTTVTDRDRVNALFAKNNIERSELRGNNCTGVLAAEEKPPAQTFDLMELRRDLACNQRTDLGNYGATPSRQYGQNKRKRFMDKTSPPSISACTGVSRELKADAFDWNR